MQMNGQFHKLVKAFNGSKMQVTAFNCGQAEVLNMQKRLRERSTLHICLIAMPKRQTLRLTICRRPLIHRLYCTLINNTHSNKQSRKFLGLNKTRVDSN